jgi:prefoldin subunit 5
MQGQLELQLEQLSRKVEALEALIERFRSELLNSLYSVHASVHTTPQSNYLGSISEHRDILVELPPQPNHVQDGQDLPPEMQIQRLMAQLTAAYSRIAALEEQLVACRMQNNR